MKKFDIIVSCIVLVLIIALCIGFQLGKITNFNTILYVLAGIVAVVFLVAYCLKDWLKSLMMALCAFVIIVGAGKTAIMISNTCTYLYAQTNNFLEIKHITNSDDFTLAFSYDNLDYYVDNNFEYLYCIEDQGFFSNVRANKIMIDTDAESVFDGYLSDFYAVDNGNKFTNISLIQISIGFIYQESDHSVFIKMIDKNNKVYYSYLQLEDNAQLLRDLDIVDYEFSINNVNILVTKPSKIIDGTETGNSQDYEDGRVYLITQSDYTFISETFSIEYASITDPYERINTYIYKDYFATIAEYEKELNKLDKSSTEYKTLQTQIDSLKNSIIGLKTELEFEFVLPDKTIRFYRVAEPSNLNETLPSINVVEIEFESYFVYSYTNLELANFK